MATETVDITLRARIDDLRATLAQVPGITAKEAKAMAGALERHVKRAEQATKRSAQQAQKEWTSRLGDIRRASSSVFGGVVNDADDVVQGLAAIHPAALAAGAGIAVVAAGVIAIGAGVAGVVKLVDATDDLIKRGKDLEKFGWEGFTVPPETEAAVLRANGALLAIRDTAGAAAATLGAEFAPAVERVATLLVAFGLAGVDALKYVAEGVDLLDAVFRGLIDGTLATFLAIPEGLAKEWVVLLDALGVDVPDALRTMSQATDLLTEAIVGGLSVGFEDLELATGDYLGQARDLIGVEVRAAAATKQHAAALEEKKKQLEQVHALQEREAEAMEKAAEASRHVAEEQIAQAQTQVQAQQAMAQAGQRVVDQELGNQEALAQAAEDRWAREQAAITQWVDYAVQAVALVGGLFMDHHASRIADLRKELDSVKGIHTAEAKSKRDNLREQIKEQRKAAIRAFRITQGASIGQAAIMGILSALTWSQPPPVGIGFPQGSIAAGVQTGLAVAGIASQKPPSFHTGRTRSAPDEVSATLTSAESVVTGRGTRALGGPGAVQAANRGQLDGQRGDGGTIVALNDRVIEKIAHRMLGLSSVRRELITLTAKPSGGYR